MKKVMVIVLLAVFLLIGGQSAIGSGPSQHDMTAVCSQPSQQDMDTEYFCCWRRINGVWMCSPAFC